MTADPLVSGRQKFIRQCRESQAKENTFSSTPRGLCQCHPQEISAALSVFTASETWKTQTSILRWSIERSLYARTLRDGECWLPGNDPPAQPLTIFGVGEKGQWLPEADRSRYELQENPYPWRRKPECVAASWSREFSLDARRLLPDAPTGWLRLGRRLGTLLIDARDLVWVGVLLCKRAATRQLRRQKVDCQALSIVEGPSTRERAAGVAVENGRSRRRVEPSKSCTWKGEAY